MADNRPLMLFDFGARGTQETLRTRLLLEAETVLTAAGRPQRQMLEELRSYIVKQKGSDARIYPILRIIHRYVNVTPTRFPDLINLLGLSKALDFIDGVRPPPQVWEALGRLVDEGAEARYIDRYRNEIIDQIESGQTDVQIYLDLVYDYLFTYRHMRPGYNQDRLTPSR